MNMNADRIKRVITNLRQCDADHDKIGVYTFEDAIEAIEQLRKERDEARDVMHSVVEEFVQHSQPSHPRHQPTPIHECEFQYAPEYGKCDACETWSDYVRICHPHADTEEEETP